MPAKPGALYSDWSSYLTTALFKIDEIIEDAKNHLHGVEFDTFVGIGLSGTLVVPTVARAMGKYFAVARKPNVSSHSCTELEGQVGRNWIFLDDLVASGSTRDTVKRIVSEAKYTAVDESSGTWTIYTLGNTSNYVGSYLYFDKRYRPHGREHDW